MRKLLLPVICSLGLSACAEHVAEREGTEVQVVPVTYSIDVEIKNNKTKKAWQELDDYVTKHWETISTQEVSIYWNSKSGKTLADKYAKYLLSQGVDSHKLSVEKYDQVANSAFSQDVRLQTVVNKVVTSVCGYEAIGNFGYEDSGCFVEGARWQSMVNPEKMLRNQ